MPPTHWPTTSGALAGPRRAAPAGSLVHAAQHRLAARRLATRLRPLGPLLPRSYKGGPQGISSVRPAFNQTDGGAFSVIVSAEEPPELGEAGINWLPVPWPDAPISLNMRV